MQREEQRQQQQRTVEPRTHESRQRLGAGHTSMHMDESVSSETTTQRSQATRSRRVMCDCPSETASISASSSRVSWRRPKQERKPIQEWSKSRPQSFHRDDRVIYVPKEERTMRTPSSQVINDAASDTPSAATAISTSTAMRRGMMQNSFNRSNTSHTTLTKQQLEKHMRHASHMTPLSGRSGTAGMGSSAVGWEWEFVHREKYDGGADLNIDQHNRQEQRQKTHGTRQHMIGASTRNKRDVPTPPKSTRSDQSADEEEELVARFYAEQHARLHKSVPKINPEAQPSPSSGSGVASRSNIQQLSNADQPQQQQQQQQQQTTNASVEPDSTFPLNSMNEQPSATTTQTNTSQYETQTSPPKTEEATHVTTLEDFRQQVIRKKQKQVQNAQEHSAKAAFRTQEDTFTTKEHHETGSQEQEIVINIEDNSLQEKDSHRSAVLSAGKQEEHLLESELALSADEQRERAVIAEEEDSHRSAVLSAVTAVSPASGIKGDAGLNEIVGFIREDNTVAEWPSRRSLVDETSVAEVVIGRDDSLILEELSSVEGKGNLFDVFAGGAAASSINLVSLHESERDMNCCAVVESVQIQDDSRVGAESQNVSAAADVGASRPPLHPALASGDRTPRPLAHGIPVGVDPDELNCDGEYEARRSYSWWSCLLTAFGCCRSRQLLREEEMARCGEEESPLVEE
ncbi:hypothetical protein LSM04_007185 [Trypanosoma melophagium]|uniref:uncharacterized protein n=1 Tax=Trypanosoma melophagium TaxID=715481 RepID=UPI00351A3107|nr:hypothetical protein LSM04_007185 [Trypanosoma melophagium]